MYDDKMFHNWEDTTQQVRNILSKTAGEMFGAKSNLPVNVDVKSSYPIFYSDVLGNRC